MDWSRVWHILKKEILQLRRDTLMLRLVLLAPIFQLILFGYALTTDIEHVATAVLDMDGTSSSRELVSRFAGSPQYFELSFLNSPAEIDGRLDSGRAQMVIQIPRGFAADLAAGRQAPVQLLLDGTDSTSAATAAGYAQEICARFSQQISVGTAYKGVDVRLRPWYNPDLKSSNYLVPGVLCLILLVTTTMTTSLAIVREREAGTLEQIIVTPIRPLELIIGKVAPFAAIGMFNVLTIVLAASVFFQVRIAGSFLLLFALTALFLTVSLSLGLLISNVSRTQQQAMMTSFFIIQPSMIFSGFMFPIDSMPPLMRALTYLIPLRHFLEIVRGIFLKGAGLDVLWPQMLWLLGLGSLLLYGSVTRFVKKLG